MLWEGGCDAAAVHGSQRGVLAKGQNEKHQPVSCQFCCYSVFRSFPLCEERGARWSDPERAGGEAS